MRYQIEKPEQLLMLEKIATDGKLRSIAAIWRSQQKRAGNTAWDKSFFVQIVKEGKLSATVIRRGYRNEINYCATLEYDRAVDWCETNLKPIVETTYAERRRNNQ